MDQDKRRTAPKASAEAEQTNPQPDPFLRLCETLPLAVFETETDDRCLYANARWSEISGQAAEQHRGHGWRDAIHPDDREWVLEEVQLARGQERMFDADFKLERPDGSVRWVHGRSLPLHQTDGTHDGFIHVIYDVTDRKLIEGQLRGSLEELKRQGDEQSQQIRNALEQLRDLIEEVSEIDPEVAPTPDRLRKSLDAAQAAVEQLAELAPDEVEDHSLDDILF